MSDELQTELDVSPSTESDVSQSGSAPEAGQNQDKKITFDEEQQRHVDDIVGKNVFKARQREREQQQKNDELQKQLDDAKSQLPQQTRPEDPATIDPFDDDLESKTAIRDSVIREQARFDAETTYRQQQDAHSAQLKQQQDQQALQKSVTDYTERAGKLGVDQAALQKAGAVINQVGMSDSIAQRILADDHGPLIYTYLADNPNDLVVLSRLEPMDAAVFIETQVKAKAIASGTKQPPSAPDPANHLKGGGAAVKDEDGFIEL